MRHAKHVKFSKYWGSIWSLLALSFPEGRMCDKLRRLIFIVDRPIGQNPKNFVRGGETVVFCGMWRTETLQAWSWQLRKGRQLPGGKGDGRLIVIEASPKNYEILTFEAQRRNLKNVLVINRALWSGSRKVTLAVKKITDANIVRESGAYSKNRDLDDPDFCDGDVTVEAESLDTILEALGVTQVDHVHMTIGGSEVEAVNGMRRMLAKFKPRVYCKSITYFKKNDSGLYKNVHNVLSEAGMEVHAINKQGNLLGKRFYAFFPHCCA